MGCNQRAPEPEPSPVRTAAAPDAASLRWEAPASWALEKSAEKGLYRAKYTVPAQGDAPNPAEVLVTRVGKGAASELDAPLDELRSDFEGPEAAKAARRERTVRGFELRELEVAGSYKFPMGPRVKKRAIAQVIKENWRGIGVGVRAPDGDLWFFRLVGPDDAVEAARSPFLAMLETLSAEGSKAP
jgi:hypothetical protein